MRQTVKVSQPKTDLPPAQTQLPKLPCRRVSRCLLQTSKIPILSGPTRRKTTMRRPTPNELVVPRMKLRRRVLVRLRDRNFTTVLMTPTATAATATADPTVKSMKKLTVHQVVNCFHFERVVVPSSRVAFVAPQVVVTQCKCPRCEVQERRCVACAECVYLLCMCHHHCVLSGRGLNTQIPTWPTFTPLSHVHQRRLSTFSSGPKQQR